MRAQPSAPTIAARKTRSRWESNAVDTESVLDAGDAWSSSRSSAPRAALRDVERVPSATPVERLSARPPAVTPAFDAPAAGAVEAGVELAPVADGGVSTAAGAGGGAAGGAGADGTVPSPAGHSTP